MVWMEDNICIYRYFVKKEKLAFCLMEDNICIYRYGEILHTYAVLVGTIHVIQGIYINWREPAFSSVVCKQKKSYKPKPARLVEIPKDNGKMRPLSIYC